MSNAVLSSDLRRYEVKGKVGDGTSSRTIITELRIEAAGPIVLTQAEAAGTPGQVYVPTTAHLTVLGDEVTIDSRLNFPGRVVKIVARRIVARSAAGNLEGNVRQRRDRLLPDESLKPDESISSPNGRYTLKFQTDGNLVLYRNRDRVALWSTKTDGKPGAVCTMQKDGNLVICDAAHNALWSSVTFNNPGSRLVVQDDGDMVLYRSNDTRMWATNTREPDRLLPDESLRPGQSLSSPNGRYTLKFQTDGRLVLYRNRDGKELWDTKTAYPGAAICIMQGDGNLVIYDTLASPGTTQRYVWLSATAGHPGSRLVVRDNGDVVICKPDDTRVWATNTREPQAEDPAIVVDGPELDLATRQPKQLGKGVTPDRLAPLQKVSKGKKGDDATSNRIEPFAPADAREVFGTRGWSVEQHPHEMHGEPGENGAPGNSGGIIVLVCGELRVTDPAMGLLLSARGGRGGDGQQGQDGADGGDGGEPFDARGGQGFASAGYQFSVPGGEGGNGGNGGRGGKAGAGGNGGSAIVYSEVPVDAVFLEVEAGSPGKPGEGGARGEGGKGAREARSWRYCPGQGKRNDGAPGKKGDEGGNPDKDGVAGKAELSNAQKAGAAILGAISVNQLVMMTDRARASYLSLGPEADDKARAEVLERMNWLSRLLEGIPPEHPHYTAARAVVLEVMGAKDAMGRGLDWFGNGPGYVPSVSVGMLSQEVTRQLGVLSRLETLNGEYAKALIDQQAATATIQGALSVGDAQLSAVAAEFANVRSKLDEEAGKIKDADAERKGAREPLQSALLKFDDKVLSSFGLSAETLFNALSQLSFTSPENPAGAALMGVSQIGTIVNEGSRNILDDSGRPIDKGYLLGEVKRISSPDLSVDLAQLADGRFASEPTYRVLAEYDKIKQLIQRFANSTVGAQDAIDQINKFIELVIARNRHVDYYNSLLGDLIELNTLERRLKLRQQISRDSLSRADPSLDQTTDYISALYETAKQDCLKALYLLYRAQCFWSLEPLNGFHNLLGASPIGVRYAQLDGANGRLSSTLNASLERIHRTPNRFPKEDEVVGVPVVLTREKHPFIFEGLELLGSARFRITPATRRSPAPPMWEPTAAVSASEEWLDPNGPNPFHGRADVRLTKIRVWLMGFETSASLHTLTIEHLGSELFCTPDNALYPQYDGGPANGAAGEPPRVYHTGVRLPFVYSPEGLRGPVAHDGFHPGRLDVDGAEDGDLGFSANIGLGLGARDCYAALGPFADWRLVVDDDQNPDANWEQCHTIVIDFHGFHQTF